MNKVQKNRVTVDASVNKTCMVESEDVPARWVEFMKTMNKAEDFNM